MSPYRLTITGQTPSKKRGMQIVYRNACSACRKSPNKCICHRPSAIIKVPSMIPNKDYLKWIKGAVSQLTRQRILLGIEAPLAGPLHVITMIYRHTLRKADKGNLEQTIHDALQEAGVINDDFLIENTDGSRRILGVKQEEARAEIIIKRHIEPLEI